MVPPNSGVVRPSSDLYDLTERKEGGQGGVTPGAWSFPPSKRSACCRPDLLPLRLAGANAIQVQRERSWSSYGWCS